MTSNEWEEIVSMDPFGVTHYQPGNSTSNSASKQSLTTNVTGHKSPNDGKALAPLQQNMAQKRLGDQRPESGPHQGAGSVWGHSGQTTNQTGTGNTVSSHNIGFEHIPSNNGQPSKHENMNLIDSDVKTNNIIDRHNVSFSGNVHVRTDIPSQNPKGGNAVQPSAVQPVQGTPHAGYNRGANWSENSALSTQQMPLNHPVDQSQVQDPLSNSQSHQAATAPTTKPIMGRVEGMLPIYGEKIWKQETETVSRYGRETIKAEVSKEKQEPYEKMVREKNNEIFTLKEEKSNLQAQLQQLRQTVAQCKRENEELSDRLAKEMNDKVSKNESSFENISVKNRPMKVAEEYEHIWTNQWLAAKGFLDEYDKQKTKDIDLFEFLLQIFMLTAKEATEVQYAAQTNITKVLKEPVRDDVKKYSSTRSEKGEDLSLTMKNAISDHLRSLSSEVIFTKIMEATEASMLTLKKNYKILLKQGPVVAFMRATSILAWKMVNQRPQLRFECEGVQQQFKDHFQLPHWGSDEPNHALARVQQYARPVMYHGNAVMAKGIVIVKHKKT